jgi:predicted ABC-class ATPase
LIDEDKSATNFMIRDKRMQMLVAKENEPITPFIYKVTRHDTHDQQHDTTRHDQRRS